MTTRFQSGYLLLGYHSKPTLFQVNTIVAVDGIFFPDITICNQNRVKTSRMLSEYLFLSCSDSFLFLAEQFRVQNLLEDMATQKEQTFGYDQLMRDVLCLSIQASLEVPRTECLCSLCNNLISNSKLNKRQFLSGSSYGWQFVLDGNNDLDSFANTDTGFRVAVHEPDKEISMQSRGLAVPPGAALHAGFFLKNISLLQRSAWGFCVDDWNPYTATHCEWNCVAREWLSTCGCVLMKHFALNVSDVSVCQPNDIQRNNISVVNIFMRSIAYERHEQQKQLQTADLLSSIAGSMGLFLGMSTITLLEIFIYLFKSVWGIVNTERQKQFMDAMMEEENERRQSVVIVEETSINRLLRIVYQPRISLSVEESMLTSQTEIKGNLVSEIFLRFVHEFCPTNIIPR
uniref:Amiloride-sensitive sodium channel n=1 Tax=Angiostrongylus cantonensis TaxID=6313 RepID=A0A0K0D2P8_ANGCA